MDDLDCEVWHVAFEANIFNRYDTFNHITNKIFKGLGYAYLDCNLLNMATLIIITLKMKSSHIEMHEHLLQKCMYVRVKKLWHKIEIK
jgi:hypothetical protein